MFLPVNNNKNKNTHTHKLTITGPLMQLDRNVNANKNSRKILQPADTELSFFNAHTSLRFTHTHARTHTHTHTLELMSGKTRMQEREDLKRGRGNRTGQIYVCCSSCRTKRGSRSPFAAVQVLIIHDSYVIIKKKKKKSNTSSAYVKSHWRED